MRVPMTHQCRDTVPVPSMGTPAVCTRQDGWFCEKWWEGVRYSQRLYKVLDFHLHSIFLVNSRFFDGCAMSAMWAKAFSRWCPWNFISLKRIHQFQKNQISNQRCASASCDISTLSSEQTKITTTSKRKNNHSKTIHHMSSLPHVTFTPSL